MDVDLAHVLNDRIVEEYIQGDRMTRQVIKDTLAVMPVPRTKLLIFLYPLAVVSLYVAIQMVGYQLVLGGSIKMTPILWVMNGAVAFAIVIGGIGFWLAYRSHKTTIEDLVNDYHCRHPESELALRFYRDHL